ncbi:DUF1361 domain-containing protein [Proteiniclasticum sp. C24MP]|uniref:DUF1361 domain-containing protein n=1 Tax=Proteiniclasticum sp. C24MP TaxID=3374101 RepID=UPI003754B3E8
MGLYKNIAYFILTYGVLSMVLFLYSGSFLFIMMVWNVILASLPLVFMKQGMKAERTWKRGVLFLLWFFFFPNAIYMITDFIHLTNDQMIWSIPVEPYSGLDGTRYSMEIMQWAKLLLIALGAFYALGIGMESLYRFHDYLRRRKGNMISFAAVALISLASSFGVFVGRFLRFNSWDIMRPVRLVKGILDSVTGFAFWFTMIYGLFVIFSFLLFRWFRTGRADSDSLFSENI